MKLRRGDDEVPPTPLGKYEFESDAAGLIWARGPEGAFSAAVVRRGNHVWVSELGKVWELSMGMAPRVGTKRVQNAVAPMPGLLVKVHTEVGAHVEAGEVLMILEAMKMQHPIRAPYAGQVVELPFGEGDQVPEGAELAHLERDEEE